MRKARMFSRFGPKPPASRSPRCQSLSTWSCFVIFSRSRRVSSYTEDHLRLYCRRETIDLDFVRAAKRIAEQQFGEAIEEFRKLTDFSPTQVGRVREWLCEISLAAF